ncbi:mechanosensitive ion channel family protein [Methanobrevibacter sp. OttesenSCG-928-K11]|nr:mechanosensitive ion channel family protein [Methanobrevibacter sp. OttesenSCG-928-K11]MDL2270585.1 mechanosensitive ion channel family protein [Methanobrevibacter sp. OttesenSCG-928-I08]
MNIIENLSPFSEIILTIIILLLVELLVKIVSFVISKISKRRSADQTLIYLLKDLIRYIIYISAIIVIFDIFGIDLTSILVSIGIASLIIGFASKDIISNFLSGVFVISDKHIKLGDTIQLDSIKGRIKKISFRTTIVVDNDGVTSIIPNSALSNKPYQRYNELEMLRVDLISIIPLKIDIEEFREKILNIINEYSEINNKKSPNLYSKEITEDGVKVKISVWINNESEIDSVKLKLSNDVRYLIESYCEG